MNYIKKNLSPGEEIGHIAKIHWFIFIRPICMVIIGLLLLSPTSKILYYIALAFLLLGIFSLIGRLLLKAGSLYAVTSKRVILKSGIIRRDALELMLNKCEGIRINQGIWGRIFNYGTLLVTTGGVTNTFRFVSAPMKFRQAINERI